MPDEKEVVQADVFVEFPLPNGKVLRGNPVPYWEGRKILAELYDKQATLEQSIKTLDRFTELAGIKEADVMAAYPSMTYGDLVASVERFFFQKSQLAKSNGQAPTTPSPSSGV